MHSVIALAEIASLLPDFIGIASRNDGGDKTSSIFPGEPRRGVQNDKTQKTKFITNIISIYQS